MLIFDCSIHESSFLSFIHSFMLSNVIVLYFPDLSVPLPNSHEYHTYIRYTPLPPLFSPLSCIRKMDKGNYTSSCSPSSPAPWSVLCGRHPRSPFSRTSSPKSATQFLVPKCPLHRHPWHSLGEADRSHFPLPWSQHLWWRLLVFGRGLSCFPPRLSGCARDNSLSPCLATYQSLKMTTRWSHRRL